MKTFTTDEIRDLYGQVTMGKISFSRMAKVINQRMNETSEPQYKNGDFVINEAGSILIFREKDGDSIYDHAYLTRSSTLFIHPFKKSHYEILGFATEEEKQKMLDALTKKGKRWNEEKKCIENIQVHKFKVGNKVRIKHGVSSKTHASIRPYFAYSMDELIGKELTVEYYDNGEFVICDGYSFLKEWLEPCEELKKGDLAIFWDKVKRHAIITFYERSDEDETCLQHKDIAGSGWENAIKFESKEQFERFIKENI